MVTTSLGAHFTNFGTQIVTESDRQFLCILRRNCNRVAISSEALSTLAPPGLLWCTPRLISLPLVVDWDREVGNQDQQTQSNKYSTLKYLSQHFDGSSAQEVLLMFANPETCRVRNFCPLLTKSPRPRGTRRINGCPYANECDYAIHGHPLDPRI